MADVEWRMTQNASAVFRELRSQIANPEPAFDQMLDYIAGRQSEWFENEGRGGRYAGWARLSRQYAEWKFNMGGGDRKIMHGPDFTTKKGGYHQGGQLKRELTQRPFGFEQINAMGFTFGTDIPYAGMHQRGAGKLPRRRVIRPMDRPGMSALEQILRDHLMPRATFTGSGRGPRGGGITTKFKSKGAMLSKGKKGRR